jgi:acetyltransferase-like isoleucine patch superfamily enzyme
MRESRVTRFASAIRRARLRAVGGVIASSAVLARQVELCGSEIEIGGATYLGPGVRIRGKRIAIGPDCHIAHGVSIQGENVSIGANSIVFSGVSIVALGDVRIGRRAKISRGVMIRAGVIEIGTDVWINPLVDIGGGGWRSRENHFVLGDRCHIGRSSHVNVARSVTIGNDTAIGMDCTLATHAQWQACTDGYSRLRGPISLGNNVAIYSRAVLGPGVTIHDGAVVGAGSVVTRDVDPGMLVGGVPAVALRLAAREEMRQNVPQLLAEFLAVGNGGQRPVVEENFFCGQLGGRTLLFASRADQLAEIPHDRPMILVTDSPGLAAERHLQAEAVFEITTKEVFGTATEESEQLAHFLFGTGLHFRYLTYTRPQLSFTKLVEAGLELP